MANICPLCGSRTSANVCPTCGGKLSKGHDCYDIDDSKYIRPSSYQDNKELEKPLNYEESTPNYQPTYINTSNNTTDEARKNVGKIIGKVILVWFLVQLFSGLIGVAAIIIPTIAENFDLISSEIKEDYYGEDTEDSYSINNQKESDGFYKFNDIIQKDETDYDYNTAYDDTEYLNCYMDLTSYVVYDGEYLIQTTKDESIMNYIAAREKETEKNVRTAMLYNSDDFDDYDYVSSSIITENKDTWSYKKKTCGNYVDVVSNKFTLERIGEEISAYSCDYVAEDGDLVVVEYATVYCENGSFDIRVEYPRGYDYDDGTFRIGKIDIY